MSMLEYLLVMSMLSRYVATQYPAGEYVVPCVVTRRDTTAHIATFTLIHCLLDKIQPILPLST